jgi:hypothetical protein
MPMTSSIASAGLKPIKISKRLMTLEEAQAKRMAMEGLLDEAKAREHELTRRWKAGEFDTLYGKFKPGGVLKVPPVRQYTE